MMADIATMFGWPPAVMDAMEPAELARWASLAAERAKLVYGLGAR